MCRHQNTLVNSTNYEKAYLIEYGYKYEDPTKNIHAYADEFDKESKFGLWAEGIADEVE